MSNQIDRKLNRELGRTDAKLQYFGHLMRRVDSLEKTGVAKSWTRLSD